MSRNLAASTLNQTRATLRGIFALATERYELDDDVSTAFKRAQTRRSTSDKISFYPPEEVMRLVNHAESEQDAALFLTAAFTGLRASELRALRWRSVGFASSLMHVERGFTDECAAARGCRKVGGIGRRAARPVVRTAAGHQRRSRGPVTAKLSCIPVPDAQTALRQGRRS
ncbi:MAG: hypothetical protein ACLP0J_27950 [Solirubrobacteraceae bacterium]